MLKERNQIASAELAIVQAALMPQIEDLAFSRIWGAATTTTGAVGRTKIHVHPFGADANKNPHLLVIIAAPVDLLVDPGAVDFVHRSFIPAYVDHDHGSFFLATIQVPPRSHSDTPLQLHCVV